RNPRMQTLLQAGWGTMLRPPSVAGVLCFSDGDGPRSRFIHPAVHLRVKKPAALPNSLPTIVRQFFATCGPGTTRELSRWLYLHAARAKEAITDLGEELEPVEVDGQRAWMIAGEAAEAKQSTPERTVRLLPSFDPWVFAAGSNPEPYLRGADHR